MTESITKEEIMKEILRIIDMIDQGWYWPAKVDLRTLANRIDAELREKKRQK